MESLTRWHGMAVSVASALALMLVFSVSSAKAQPDLNGIWRVLASDENIAPYVMADLGEPGSAANSRIPYTADARRQQQENATDWIDRDPVLTDCASPGVPRATYMGNLIKIEQEAQRVVVSYEVPNTEHVIHVASLSDDAPQSESVGRWEQNTLVVDLPVGIQSTWLDRHGNYVPEASAPSFVERYTLVSPDKLLYEVTIDNRTVFTGPWTISITLTRVQDAELRSLNCAELTTELLVGRLVDSEIVVPRGELVAWESYPSGLLFRRGDNVTTIGPGERYRVTARRVIPSFFSRDRHYVKIAALGNPDSPCARDDCWVYAGDGVQSNLDVLAIDPAGR